ncbi:MAG TPA: hypothetical protein VF712_18390 [Thermoleophilaceae bacterium]
MDRSFIYAYGPDAEAERAGVIWLAREARRQGSSGAIVVPGIESIRNLARAIGRQGAAFAEKHRYFIVEGTRIEVFSERTKPGRFDGPVLVPWANDAMVNAAEEMGPPSIRAIPWGESDLVEWKRAWNPIDARTSEPVGEGPAAGRQRRRRAGGRVACWGLARRRRPEVSRCGARSRTYRLIAIFWTVTARGSPFCSTAVTTNSTLL